MSKPLFDEEPSGLRGVNALYRDEIQPGLAAFDRRRLEARPVFWRYLLIGLSPVLVICGFMVYFGQAGVALILGAIAAWFIWSYLRKNYRSYANTTKIDAVMAEHRAFVVGRIASFLGHDFHPKGFPDLLDRVRSFDFIPMMQPSYTEDGLSGSLAGLDFRYTDIVTPGDHGEKDFHDAAFLIQARRRFASYVVVYWNSAPSGTEISSPFRSAERIRLEDPEFDRMLYVLSPDQVGARTVLTPLMMERMKEFFNRFPAAALCFIGEEVFVHIAGWNLFESGDMDDDLNDPARTRRVALEMLLMPELALALGLVEDFGETQEFDWM